VPFPAAPVGVAEPQAAPTATARPAAPRVTAPAAASRGIVTDYGYVIGELRRIGIITAAIVLLLLLLWLVIA
jgi:hypothetical protein